MEYCIGNSDYIENVTILVKGTYYDSIFKNDRFEGKISVDKYDFTYEKKLLPLYFFNNNYATIRYTYTNTSTDKKDITLGFLRTTSDFNKILIEIAEPLGGSSQSWDADSGLLIAAPAKNINIIPLFVI